MNQITKDLLEENKEDNLEGNDLYIEDKEIRKLEREEKKKKVGKFENEDFVKDGSAVHIFGCINFPSE